MESSPGWLSEAPGQVLQPLGPRGPPWEVRGRRQRPLTTGGSLLLCQRVIRVGFCLLLNHWLGLVGLVVLGGDQLHQALVAHVGHLLDA